MRLTILRMVQQVFGTKAVLILQQEAHADVSGIDLTKITGLELLHDKIMFFTGYGVCFSGVLASLNSLFLFSDWVW